mmetsp:Transcript_32145/g.60405  ORF Transcript_32145/g.60405 Transcript_32145/m.60405 type:complete len:206 (+) Transcript_32145:334-951(+)
MSTMLLCPSMRLLTRRHQHRTAHCRATHSRAPPRPCPLAGEACGPPPVKPPPTATPRARCGFPRIRSLFLAPSRRSGWQARWTPPPRAPGFLPTSSTSWAKKMQTRFLRPHATSPMRPPTLSAAPSRAWPRTLSRIVLQIPPPTLVRGSPKPRSKERTLPPMRATWLVNPRIASRHRPPRSSPRRLGKHVFGAAPKPQDDRLVPF